MFHLLVKWTPREFAVAPEQRQSPKTI